METVTAKTILSKNKSTEWFGAEYNMNIYRGCSHGCIYCDSRSSCYHVENFDKVRAKKDALLILRDQLARKVKSGMVATGAMSDPYNPFEKEQQLSRHAAELIDAYEFGLAIATKSDLITRDIDVFQSIKQHSPMLCKLTITCAEDKLAQKIEPNVALSSKRFAALEKLSKAGIYSGVLLMPLLPFINDTEENIRGIIRQSANAGARFIYPMFGLTMRDGQREYFYEQLSKKFPKENYAAKYNTKYGTRYICNSPKTKHLVKFFTAACEDIGMLYKMQDIIRGCKQGYASSQLSFFT